jgi:hypothetical protein
MSDTYKNIKTNGAVPKDEPIVAEAVQPTEVPEPHSAPTSRQRELLDQAEDLALLTNADLLVASLANGTGF